MNTLADYQQAFGAALLAQGDHPASSGEDAAAAPMPAWLARLTSQPGFAVYRNTVIKGCVDALAANFPAVARLVGHEWMRAACAVYARGDLPCGPMLLHYGRTFPTFLSAFEPAAGLPWLPAVAALDRAWVESHAAADAPVLPADALLAIEPALLAEGRLNLHPAARWRWCADAPAYTLWSRNRVDKTDCLHDEDRATDDAPIDWRPEGALLTRPFEVVMHRQVARSAIAFLDACDTGCSLGEAALAAMDAEPAVDIAALIGSLLGAGTFSSFRCAAPAA
jgi:hypothetical protein